MTPDIDWEALIARAREAAARAYAPYSRLRVGAAGITGDGRIIAGCNVENASYGLTLCAECGVVSSLHASGGGRLVAVAVVGADGGYLAPCGRCRQLLLEAGGPSLQILTREGVRTIGELLPGAFDAGELDSRREA
ncbi:MAG TPA: cytidine deaminase [Actinomycetota bacterium]|jgi:cytidine deaminase|nr:cytidine deaminase [Actinomycetota bacterium]